MKKFKIRINMKELISDKELQKMIEEIIKEFPPETLFEAPGDPIQQPVQPKKVVKPVAKNPVATVQQPKKVVKNVEPKPVVKRPTSQTIPGPKDKPEPEIKKAYDPVKAREKQQLGKVQYQIFNIKMRLGKLGLNDALRRFAQSIHDFDINITKNSKDNNEIRSYMAPAQGNLVALKGALESLEAEFDELNKLLEEE